MVTGCSFNQPKDNNFYCLKLKLNCLRENKIISFETSKGNFDVILDGENNPVTVNNFTRNIKNNIYENKRFYKVIKFPQVKLVYSGIYPGNDFYKTETDNLNKFRRNIPLEIKLNTEIEPKYRYQVTDPSHIAKLTNVFEKGSIAMVKRDKRNSSSTEFFFVTNKFPELDGRYSIFGKIVKGHEILDKIVEGDIIYGIVISN